MKNVRILFMGTPEFAVTILQKLIKEGYNVVGVITAPDRPAGRGQKLRKSAVKQYAETQDIPILQPTNLKDQSFLEVLTALEANLQIVVAFRMLPEVVWKMPELGTFNLHASLLPQYRGAAPINWAIINGDKITGVTTFFIDEKIDTGAIILQEEIPIAVDETAGTLHDKLMLAGADLVIKTVNQIASGDVSTYIQPKEEQLKTAYKLHNENTKINWDASLDDIYNLIRGLSPYPSAWCYLNNGNKEERVKIYGASKKHPTKTFSLESYSSTDTKINNPEEPGTICIEGTTMKVSTPEGFLYITEMQLPGKRKMAIKDLLNGYKFDENAKMR